MAATFFGEVVKAPCRAGTEDEEEEEEGEEGDARGQGGPATAGTKEGGSAPSKTDKNIFGRFSARKISLLQVHNRYRK